MYNPFIRDTNNENLIYNLNKINNCENRGTLVEIHLADLHFGALDPKVQYDIFMEQVLYKIKDVDFDLISINGDLFDHKCTSNSNIAMYTSMIIGNLVELCRMKNATLIILAGTMSHDSNQLKLFYHYLKDKTVDIRIIEEVKFEYVKNAKILCIPELYGKGKEYYQSFLNDEYDSVFMHGTLKGSIYGANEGNLNSVKSPIFEMDDFTRCKGPIISGHVHIPGCFNTYFYYCGSLYRWKFGEEEEKGFLVLLHNLDTRKHYIHLEPVKSFRYDTVNLNDMLKQDPRQVIQYIDQLHLNGIDFIRVEFDCDVNETEKSNLEIIRKYYYNNKNIKLKIDIDNNISSIDNDVLKEYDKYDYILDETLSNYEILSRYINQKKGYKYISANEIKTLVEEEI